MVVVVVRSEDEGESHDRANLTMRAEDAAILIQLQRLHIEEQRMHVWPRWAAQHTPSTDAVSQGAAAAAAHDRSTSTSAPRRQVVVIVVSGGPVDTSQPAAAMGSGGVVTSVMAAWQPGEEGGNAIAALLWGDVDFSASLAATVYRQNFTTASNRSTGVIASVVE